MKSTVVALVIASIIQIAHSQNQSGSFTRSPKSNAKVFQSSASESAWLTEAQAYIQKSEYFFKSISASGFASANRAQKVVYTIRSNGYSVAPVQCAEAAAQQSQWNAGFQLLSVGKGLGSFASAPNPSTTVNEGFLVQEHSFFSVEYKNDENGLRQDFIIKSKPEGEKDLDIRIALHEQHLRPFLNDGQTLELKNKNGKTIIKYDALKVWDTKGRLLAAHMELTGKNTLDIIVHDRQAVYPLTIDPLNHTAEWSGTARAFYQPLSVKLPSTPLMAIR
jgi:hypothetical protein